MGMNIAAAVWGLAEATLFFVVPDVLLSALALRNGRAAAVACLWALGGALIGGLVMYVWGALDASGAWAAVEAIPAINRDMLDEVHRDLHEGGVLALLVGPLSGTPYKAYAVQAAAAGIGWGPFLLISVPARLARFFIVTLFCWGVGHYVLPHWTVRRKLALLFAGWIIFYAVYFTVMPH